MGLRVALVTLIVLATAGFVVGTSLERNTGESRHESAATRKAEGRSSAGVGAEGTSHAAGGKKTVGEGRAAHAAEGARPTGETPASNGATSTEHAIAARHGELRPFGVNVEAVPFVILAAVGSLAMALAAWHRPRSRPLLIAIAAAMLAFAVLDLREVSHQSDEDRTALAALAAVIAALHLGAAAAAAFLLLSARSREAGAHRLGGV